MPDKRHLERLAEEVRHAVQQFNPEDASGLAAVRAAIVKLERSLDTPAQAIAKQRLHTVENLSIIAAEEMGLLDILTSENESGAGKKASDIAAATGYDQTLIVRIMRVITAIGFADEIGYQQYKANDITRVHNTPGATGGFLLTNDVMFVAAGQIREYFRQSKPCKLEESKSAYEFAAKQPIWNTLRENQRWKTAFDDAMTSRQKLFATPWHVKFPLTEHLASIDTSQEPIIVDIGGNQGVDLQRIVDSYPHLKCRLILQDLPETLKGIPPGSLSDRVEQTLYDFFTPQPIPGASIYYLKSVLHDWDDVASQKILSNTAKVMDENSRILINDIVLTDVDESADRADMDILMLFTCNGMERSRSQWVKLLESVSPPLEIVKIWSVPQDAQSVIEARLVPAEDR